MLKLLIDILLQINIQVKSCNNILILSRGFVQFSMLPFLPISIHHSAEYIFALSWGTLSLIHD